MRGEVFQIIMKFPALALALATLITAPCFANDASFSGIVGSPTLSKGEHRAIRMESEKVILTLRPANKFETNASFVFVNDSAKAVAVKMGFPETNYGDGWEDGGQKVGFQKFATTVNGRAVRAKRTILNSDGDVWWIKTVSFAPRERVNVRVMATSEVGGSVDYSMNRALSYHFTGGNWKGLVARSDLEVRIPQPGLWVASGSSWDEKRMKTIDWKPTVEVKNGVAYLRKSWRNWQAQSAVNVGIRRVMPSWLLDTRTLVLNEPTFMNMTTFQVGESNGNIGTVDRNPPQGFVRDGVAMVSWKYLFKMADDGKMKTTRGWNAATREATLTRGATQIAMAPGNRAMTVTKGADIKTVALPAAPILVATEDGERMLYVPMQAAAAQLGLRADVYQATRRFLLGG